nr:retrovirus-related Pol polyprotein from transposon TNT 1-94 [Tanacetum cinerariifolium]
MQFDTSLSSLAQSLIISLWFDPVDCHDYPSRGYHIISCVDLYSAITFRKPCLYSLFVREACAGAIYCTKVCTKVCAGAIYPNKVVSEPGYDKQWQKTKGHFQNQCSKLVASRDKVVNMVSRDSDDALVCCVENTVEDRIMDSGASFHATYCKEELERFKLRSSKVCLAYDKTLDIAAVRDVVLKTSFGTSWTLRDVRYIPGLKRRLILVGQLEEEGYHFGVAERLSRTFIAESMGLRAEDSKMLWADSVSAAYLIYRIPYILIRMRILEDKWLGKDTSLAHLKRLGGSSDTSEGSENIRSFEDSGRSDEDSEDGASSKTCMKIQQRVQGSSKKKAINEEMVSLEKNQTCSLVRISARKKASQILWLFMVKEEQNISKRYKAQLVVKGFQLKRGVDYNEIFSPFAKMTIISEGFQLARQKENLECKLKKSLYGLKQAPRQWLHHGRIQQA